MDRNVQGGERDARPHRKTLLRTHEWVLAGATQNLPMSSESSISTPDFFEERRGGTALNSASSTEIRAPLFIFSPKAAERASRASARGAWKFMFSLGKTPFW